jgi:CRP-like cAMP-binding protein
VNPLWDTSFIRRETNKSPTFLILRKIPIFSDLTDKELKEVEKIAHLRKYSANELIFHQGTPGNGMYVIMSGSVDIMEELRDNQFQHLTSLKKGDFLGELSLLDESPRSAAAICKENSEIIGIFRPDFLDLVNRKPGIGTKILFRLARVLGERLRMTNEMLQHASTDSSNARK